MKQDDFTPRSITSSLLRKLGGDLRDAARSPDDATAVHDLRVTIRRLTQAVRTFPEVFGERTGKKIRHHLKKLMSDLGEVRNVDIVMEMVHEVKAGSDAHLQKDLQDQRQTARKHLEKRLKSWRKRDVLGDWKTAMHPNSGGAASLEQAHVELSDMTAGFFQAGNESVRATIPFERLHRIRLLGKRLRYTLELFSDAKKFKTRLAILKEVQDYLGKLNDCVTAIDLARDYPEVVKRVRALLARREAAYRTFWKNRFPASVQESWLNWSIEKKQPGKEYGALSTSSRRRRTA